MKYAIVFLGLVSFFMDLSTEMVYPLIPLYLTAAFGATPALVGIIEGIAESLAGLLKVFSGYLTDKYKNKKIIAFIGYATGLLYKVALIFSSSWTGILSAKVLDRFGKGIRTAPRDVMISDNADRKSTGKSFGIHKALDMAGSALGILISFILLKTLSQGMTDYRIIFAISAVPAILSLVCFVFIKEKKEPREPKAREKFWKNGKKLSPQLKLYLVITAVFTLGNSSNSFLLLRATDVGFDNTSVLLLYLLFNVVASVLSIPFGKLSDRIGRKKLLAAGYILFAVVYAGFAFASDKYILVAAFALYGVYSAMTAGVEKALISEISPRELRGTMLGFHSTVVGVALLPASILCGFLWNTFGAQVPFVAGAGFALVAAVLLIVFFKPVAMRDEQKTGEEKC
ncbi:MAG: MFS transporter [Christensenellales bacterium]